MANLKKLEILQEQYNAGNAIIAMSQYIPDGKLALKTTKEGIAMAAKALTQMLDAFEPGDDICPPLPWWWRNEIFLNSLKTEQVKQNIKLTELGTFNYLNELYNKSQKDTQGQIVSVANITSNSFGDDVNFCGTRWGRGPKGGPIK
jgi:hypothetical protein